MPPIGDYFMCEWCGTVRPRKYPWREDRFCDKSCARYHQMDAAKRNPFEDPRPDPLLSMFNEDVARIFGKKK